MPGRLAKNLRSGNLADGPHCSTEEQVLQAMSPYVSKFCTHYMNTVGKDERDMHALTELTLLFLRRGVMVSRFIGMGNVFNQLIDAWKKTPDGGATNHTSRSLREYEYAIR
jgi:hypothetical protein